MTERRVHDADVSDIRSLPQQSTAHICNDGEHVLVRVDGVPYTSTCARCGVSAQGLRDWFGHSMPVQEVGRR